MKFDKDKCLTKDNSNIKVYIDRVDSDQSIILDNEYIFLDSIKTTMDILVMKKTIVLGDIECNFLNAVEEIICYGNITANSIYTNKDIEYFKEIKYNNLLSGNLKKKGNNEVEAPVTKEVIKVVEVPKEVIKEVEVNPLEDIEINNKNLIDNLSIIDEFKDKILKYIEGDLIFLEDDILVEDLKEIGLTFLEYEKYSNALNKVINYSKIEKIDTLNDALDFINAVSELPSFLEGQDIVENTIDKHKNVFTYEILDMKINCEDKYDFIKLLSNLNNCKDKIEDDYDEVANNIINCYYENKFKPSSSVNDKNNIVDIFKEIASEELSKKEEHNNSIDINELYEKYIWKKGSLIFCKVNKVLSDYIVVEEIENSDNEHITMIMNTNDAKYCIGDRIYACISDIALEENKLKVTVSNDQDNMPRLLFNKLKETYGLNKCTIQKYKRIKGKSTCIVIVLLSKDDYKDIIENISKEMEKYLDNESVSIFVYDIDEIKFASNILNVSKSCITIDKLQNKCIVNVDKKDEDRVNILLDKQGINIKNIFAYEIVVQSKEIISKQPQSKPQTKAVSCRDTYISLLSKQGKIIGGKITKLESESIYIDTIYNAEIVIKYFDKKTIEQYKVGDYIEGIVDSISKKADGSIKATLSRLRLEFIKVLLKTVRDEIGLKDITFKSAKLLKSKDEFAVLYTSTLNKVSDNNITLIKEKVEERLNGEKVSFYKYDSKLIEQINNITGVKVKDAITNDKDSKCIITCDANDEVVIKKFTEVLGYFTLCKNIEIICEDKDTTITSTVEKSKFDNLIRKYNEYKWNIVEGTVTNISSDKVEFNINNEVVGVLNKNSEIVSSKTYKVGEKTPCYIFDVAEKNNRIELSLMKNSENYFKQLFKYYKNQLGINLISIKSCKFDKHRGVLILIENRYKKVTKEELNFIEELMNNECGEDIVKIVEFNYNAEKFICDLFDIRPIDIVNAQGKYYLSNLDYSKIDRYRFIHEIVSKMFNYKIVL